MRSIVVLVENRPFFGALLVHVPLLHALRTRHPGARIGLVAPFPQAGLLVRPGLADEAVEARGFAAVRAAVSARRPDLALSLRPASRGLDLAIALAARGERAGFDSLLGRFAYTHRAPHDTAIYRPRKYLTLVGTRATALEAPLDAWFRAAACDAAAPLEPGARTLAVLPGGGAGAFKQWGIERFLALAGSLAAEDAALRFAWVLGPQERELEARIAASAVAARSRCLTDLPLGALAATAFACEGAVGNDCGPGHVFQMCGCPFTCVIADHDGTGPRRADEWLDASNRARAVLSAPGTPIGSIAVPRVAEAVRAMRRG